MDNGLNNDFIRNILVIYRFFPLIIQGLDVKM